MIIATYLGNDSIYEVKEILDNTVVKVDAVESLALVDYNVESVEAYECNMDLSIEQKLAFDVYKNNQRIGYVYNIIDNEVYIGCSIHLVDTIGMLLAFKTMFEICDKHRIIFAPHGNNINMFKSLVYGPSYRMYNNGSNTVTILKDDMVSKGQRMFKYLGIEEIKHG